MDNLKEFLNELQLQYPKIDASKLELYLNISIVKITNYLNIDITSNKLIKKYKTALIVAVGNEINSIDKKDISSYREGNISITYKDKNKLSDDVKALLPIPFVKLMG